MKYMKEGKPRKFWMDNVFLYFGDHIYVPKSSNLQKELLRECHASLWDRNPRQQMIMALLERGYYWECMRQDMEEYV
jgi:hypothetical protein